MSLLPNVVFCPCTTPSGKGKVNNTVLAFSIASCSVMPFISPQQLQPEQSRPILVIWEHVSVLVSSHSSSQVVPLPPVLFMGPLHILTAVPNEGGGGETGGGGKYTIAIY